MAASDWLTWIRELKSLTTLISNRWSVFPHTSFLVPDSNTFETSTRAFFYCVNIIFPQIYRRGDFVYFLDFVLKT